jgi:hypothetical protein
VGDELTMRTHEVHIAVISMYRTDLKDKIITATNFDQNYLKIKETLQQGNFQQKFNSYCWFWSLIIFLIQRSCFQPRLDPIS